MTSVPRNVVWSAAAAAVAGLLTIGVSLGGFGGDDDDDRGRVYDIGLWGDLPYSAAQETVGLPNLIADMNAHNLEFTVHDGDLKAGSTCKRRAFVISWRISRRATSHRRHGQLVEVVARRSVRARAQAEPAVSVADDDDGRARIVAAGEVVNRSRADLVDGLRHRHRRPRLGVVADVRDRAVLLLDARDVAVDAVRLESALPRERVAEDTRVGLARDALQGQQTLTPAIQ